MTVLQVIIDVLQGLAIVVILRKQNTLVRGVNKLSKWANDIVMMQVRKRISESILSQFGNKSSKEKSSKEKSI